MIYSKTSSGLLVAEQGASDERAVARALRDYDPELRLVPQAMVEGRTAYKVYRYAGADRPAQFLLFWGDVASGEPYPLSMRLLDELQRHDKNLRGDFLDEDTLNARARMERERQHAADTEGLAADSKNVGKTILHRSPGLVMARRRQRRAGENV